MKINNRKIISLLLTILFLPILVFAGCDAETINKHTSKSLPDYSKYNHQMNFYGYSSITDGTWTIDGEIFTSGTDFRKDIDKYIEYREAGLNIFFPQLGGSYSGRVPWEGSEAQLVMDNAYAAGIDKVILQDTRLHRLSDNEGGVIGPGKQFANEDEIDAYVADCIKDYKDHPALYGLMLMDEPRHTKFQAIADVYKSIKRVAPNLFVQCNLLPAAQSVVHAFPELDESDGDVAQQDVVYVRYAKYLNLFLDLVESDYLIYDMYPMRGDGVGISSQYVRTLQTAARVCMERGVELHNVTQTFAMLKGGSSKTYRECDENDMYWLTNMLIGFGVKEIAYFTYFTKQSNSTSGELFLDGTSFIDRNGSKTPLYYSMQKIHREIQDFAPTVMNFEYRNSTYLTKIPTSYSTTHLHLALQEQFINNIELSIDKECALVSELYDAENKQYMYMLQNVINPIYTSGTRTLVEITIKFPSNFTHIGIYNKGLLTRQPLDRNNSYSVKLAPGHAQYILPY